MTTDDSDESFKDMVAYFWKERRDPTRFTDWDPERCRRLMPQFYEAWSKAELYREMANTLAEAGR